MKGTGHRSIDAKLKALSQTTDQHSLAVALADQSPLVVEAAAKRLTFPGAIPAILQAFWRLDDGAPESDHGCWARMALLEALGRLAKPGDDQDDTTGVHPDDIAAVARRAIRAVQVEAVGFGMADTATGLRVAAASLLANVGPDGALVDLAWLLFDHEPNAPCSNAEGPFAKLATRVAAAKAIGSLGDPAGTAVLALKLAFPKGELPDLLVECMDALVALREPRTVELLQPFLLKGDAYLAAAAATDMAAVGGAAVVPLLVHALEQIGPDGQEPLLYAIASIRAEEARQALRSLATHPDPRIAKVAQELTGASGR
ncbi:MAG: HEAT repeat domain-containing protein [Mycobacterium leprae]